MVEVIEEVDEGMAAANENNVSNSAKKQRFTWNQALDEALVSIVNKLEVYKAEYGKTERKWKDVVEAIKADTRLDIPKERLLNPKGCQERYKSIFMKFSAMPHRPTDGEHEEAVYDMIHDIVDKKKRWEQAKANRKSKDGTPGKLRDLEDAGLPVHDVAFDNDDGMGGSHSEYKKRKRHDMMAGDMLMESGSDVAAELRIANRVRDMLRKEVQNSMGELRKIEIDMGASLRSSDSQELSSEISHLDQLVAAVGKNMEQLLADYEKIKLQLRQVVSVSDYVREAASKTL